MHFSSLLGCEKSFWCFYEVAINKIVINSKVLNQEDIKSIVFKLSHPPYFNYFCRKPAIAAVGCILNVFRIIRILQILFVANFEFLLFKINFSVYLGTK